MSSEYERRLEAEIERELKCLPDLPAPATLSLRVMTAIRQRAATPWYHQSWPAWPMPVRVSALLVLLLLFGLLCYAGWEFSHLPTVLDASQKVGGVVSFMNALWNALGLLAVALVLVIKHLGTWFILGLLAMLAITYGTCMGLGSVYFKLAFARR
jgi:hypothetical protein